MLDQSHSSVERAGSLGSVKMTKVKTDSSLSMRGADLKAAIAADKARGLIPFFVIELTILLGKDNLKVNLFRW